MFLTEHLTWRRRTSSFSPLIPSLLLVLLVLLQSSSLQVTSAQPARNDADYEYNTEANHNRPSPVTPGIQPSTIYSIHALPSGGGPSSSSSPPLYINPPNMPKRGAPHLAPDEVPYDYSDLQYDDYYLSGEDELGSGVSSVELSPLQHPVSEVHEGDTLKLKCKTEGVGEKENVYVNWYFNGTEISGLFHHRRFKFISFKTPPRLRLHRVRPNDAGVYSGKWRTATLGQAGWCNHTVVVVPSPTSPHRPPPALALQAHDDLYDDSDRAPVSLAPKFTRRLQNMLVKPAGNVAELKCPASGDNLVTKWLKNGEEPSRKIGEMRIRRFNLKMENLVPMDSGNYTCIVSNEHGSVNHTFHVEIIAHAAVAPIFTESLKDVTVMAGESLTLQVSVYTFNTPAPYIMWCKDLNVTSFGERGEAIVDPRPYMDSLSCQEGGHLDTTKDPQVLELSNVSTADQGWYTCLAANSIGFSQSTAYVTVIQELPSRVPDVSLGVNTMLVIVVGVALMTLTSGCCMFTYCYYKKWKHQKRRTIELEKSRNALPPPIKKKVIVERQENEHSDEPLLEPDIKIEQCVMRDCMSANSKSEYELPLDEYWELRRDCLVVDNILGEGAFGRVYRAELFDEDSKTNKTVAVKMLKDVHSDSELMVLIKEMEMMKIIGRHQNIISLVGCCTQDGPLYVVVEYAHLGNLRDYLRNSQPYHTGYECAIDDDSKPSLTQKDLLRFAYQVARGMEYLASKKCVHRDLAARNVLVTEELIMKIADFGLARDLHSQDYYRKNSDGRLPVKWMAPESLMRRVYTSKSDVWAFGILLWEIMSLGETPYPSLVKLERLFQLIREGERMPKPANCTNDTYLLMKDCWRFNPNDRPNFREIHTALSRQLSEVTNDVYLDLSLTQHLDTPPSSYDSSVTTVMLPP